jgi:V/A-type H+-transporting ATPase subunit D
MIHPTRTNLLLLKEKFRSVSGSIGILKARREALIREFLKTSIPFLRSRQEISKTYWKAIGDLSLSLGHEGMEAIESLTFLTARDFRVGIKESSIWGLKYKDITIKDSPLRTPDERGYNHYLTSPHIEECIHLFERLLASMFDVAAYESKLKRLGNEILMTTRRVKVLEERVLPGLKNNIRKINQHLGEREREAYYRLKRFKDMRF